MSVEIQDLDKKVPWPADDYMTPLSKRGPPPFDFERLIRFMGYGFMMAPVQHKWFGLLHKLFPIENGKGTANAFRRVAFDQFIFAPIGMFEVSPHLRKVLTMRRSRGVLHIHDGSGGRREEGSGPQVSGRLPALTESQLYRMAVGSSAELPGHANPVPDRELHSYILKTGPD